MLIYNVFHQFEIRFTKLIRFPDISRALIAPYVKIFTDVRIERENTQQQKIYLDSVEEGYSIVIWNDRMIFQSTNDFNNFRENNSLIQEPFFSIYNKLEKHEDFGLVKNYLFFIATINKDLDGSLESYMNNNFKLNFNSLFNLKDCAITLESNEKDKFDHNLTFGPYLGIADLQKRNININHLNYEKFEEKGGLLADLKCFKNNSQINFKIYQELIDKSNNILKSLWLNQS